MNIDVIAFEYVNLRKGNKSSLHCTYLRCSPKSSKVSFDGDSNTGGIHQKCAFPKRKTTSKSPSYRSTGMLFAPPMVARRGRTTLLWLMAKPFSI